MFLARTSSAESVPLMECPRAPTGALGRSYGRAQSRVRPRLWLHDNADVLSERCEQAAQPLHREAFEPPPVQVREIGLGHPEPASGGPLRQAPRLNELLNRGRQVGLREQFISIAKPQVRGHIAGARRDRRFIRARLPADLRYDLTHSDAPSAARASRGRPTLL